MTVLLNPMGEKVGKEDWDAYTANDYVHRIFEDERISALLRAKRAIQSEHVIPEEHWMRFGVEVNNIISTDIEGKPLASPRHVTDIDASREFRTFEEATKHYDLFLAKYTASEYDSETGKLKEVGNKLAPPNPDIPMVAAESPMSEAFGSW